MRIIDDITQFIFVENKPEQADVIFMPGGSDPAIPERSAELFHAGVAPLLLPSGGVSVKTGKFNGVKRKADIYDKPYRTDCAFYADVLLKSGVPEDAIVWEDKSGHTRDNAFFSRDKMDELGIPVKRAIICCKNFHARRCLMLYQLAFPEAELFVVPVEVYGITKENWHTQEYGVDRVLGELSRCGNQFPVEIKQYLSI